MPNELDHFEFSFTHEITGETSYHSHEWMEIIYYEYGSGTIGTADGKTFSFNRHSVIIHPQGMSHNQTNKTTSMDCCLLVKSAINLNHSVMITHLKNPCLRQELSTMARIKKIKNQQHQRICDLRITALLMELMDIASSHGRKYNQEQSLDTRLGGVYEYIQNNFDIIENFDDVASGFELSYDYMRHQFTKKYKISPKQFLLSLRLEHAKKLLSLSNLPQKIIAQQCGFDNIRYFNTRFNHYFGMSPGKFRQNKNS